MFTHSGSSVAELCQVSKCQAQASGRPGRRLLQRTAVVDCWWSPKIARDPNQDQPLMAILYHWYPSQLYNINHYQSWSGSHWCPFCFGESRISAGLNLPMLPNNKHRNQMQRASNELNKCKQSSKRICCHHHATILSTININNHES